MTRIPLDDMTDADLASLYERAECAEDVNRRITDYTATQIRRALECLPAMCRYHGDHLNPDHVSWGREACCDTGLPSLRRRDALEALAALTTTAAPPRGGITRTPAETGEITDCGYLPTSRDTARTLTDTRNGTVRTYPPIGEATTCIHPPTSADTVRTQRDSASADTGHGVRIEHPRMPRHLLGAAITEALSQVARETTPATDSNQTTPDREADTEQCSCIGMGDGTCRLHYPTADEVRALHGLVETSATTSRHDNTVDLTRRSLAGRIRYVARRLEDRATNDPRLLGYVAALGLAADDAEHASRSEPSPESGCADTVRTAPDTVTPDVSGRRAEAAAAIASAFDIPPHLIRKDPPR